MSIVVVDGLGGRPGRLIGVPAVHFQAVFAESVRRACLDPATRPQALAVELAPTDAAAVAEWIDELGAAGGRLPCVLALARTPEAGVAAPTPAPAATESPAAGEAPTGAQALNLLVLSPTDSIIEAVRCSIEFDIPLYAVDLDHAAVAGRVEASIEDSAAVAGDLAGWVGRNSAYASLDPVRGVDDLREATMAAGIGALLARYSSVLFTGGVGHWDRLVARLATAGDDFMPERVAPGTAAASGADYQRVLVHPAEGWRYIDSFPSMGFAYEAWRARRPDAGAAARPAPTRGAQFDRLLEVLYRQYFRTEAATVFGALGKRRDRGARRSFEQLLGNLVAVHGHAAPSVPLALEAAAATMSAEFVDALAQRLFRVKWASPSRFPGLPVVGCPDQDDGRGLPGLSSARVPRGLVRLKLRGFSQRGYRITRSGDRHRHSARGTVSLGWLRSWPPSDRITAALCYQAGRLADGGLQEQAPVKFSGSWNGRLDVRATLRSFVRGEKAVYLRESRVGQRERGERLLPWEPVVFLFPTGEAERGEFEVLRFALRNGDADEGLEEDGRLREVAEQNRGAVPCVGFTGDRDGESTFGVELTDVRRMHGVTLFAPPHLVTPLDEAIWLAEAGPGRVPTPERAGFASLCELLASEHGIDVDGSHWTSALVRMAIPFALERVLVVAPDGFRPEQAAFADAAARGIELAMVPSSQLPSEMLERVSSFAMTRALADSPGCFPEAAEITFGERADAYGELVPPAWRFAGTG